MFGQEQYFFEFSTTLYKLFVKLTAKFQKSFITICSYRIIMESYFIRLHVYPSFYFPFVLNLVAPGNIFRFIENSISWKSSNFLKPRIYDKRMVLYLVNICFQLMSNIFCFFLIDISMNAGFFSSIEIFIEYIYAI